MKSIFAVIGLGLSLLWGCGSEDDESAANTPTSAAADTTSSTAAQGVEASNESGSNTVATTGGQLTLATCEEAFGTGTADFYTTYFACVSATSSGEGTAVSTDGLPPHPSAY